MRVGRNEACPCGSKKKFKACCAGKTAVPKGLIVLLAAFVLIAGVAFIPSRDQESAPLPAAPRTAATRPAPQPPGAVPPGKVWSVQHGHWHDIGATGTTPASPIQVQQSGGGVNSQIPVSPAVGGANKPQPPGPVPAGKVWSPEHGHWHDAQ